MSIDYALGDDHVVTITINRPEARNSMDMEHFFELRSAWDRFGEDDDAYVAIVTGVGKDFCVGADLKTYIPQITELQSKMKDGEHPEELGGYRLDDGVKAVLRGTKLYKPIIAAVNGTCVAGGMEMLGGTDLRVASDTATFGVMEPKRGLFAGGGTTVRLPRQIPWPAAMELLLCADQVPAPARLRDGPAQRGLPPGRPDGAGLRLRPPHHGQRPLRRPQDQGVSAARPGHRHEGGLPDRVGDLRRGLQQRGRQGGPARLRREARAQLEEPLATLAEVPRGSRRSALHQRVDHRDLIGLGLAARFDRHRLRPVAPEALAAKPWSARDLSDGWVLSVREHTGPSRRPAAAAMAPAWATAWWTALARASSSTLAGLLKEKLRELICAASPLALTTSSMAAPAVFVSRSVAVIVLVAW